MCRGPHNRGVPFWSQHYSTLYTSRQKVIFYFLVQINKWCAATLTDVIRLQSHFAMPEMHWRCKNTSSESPIFEYQRSGSCVSTFFYCFYKMRWVHSRLSFVWNLHEQAIIISEWDWSTGCPVQSSSLNFICSVFTA